MKRLITMTALLFTSISYAQNSWEKVEISSNLGISFPGTPLKNVAADGRKSFILKHADSTANFIVATADLSIALGLDEATINGQMESQESWDQAKNAFVASIGAGVTLLKDEMTLVRGVKAMKLKIDKKFPNGSINNITVFIIVKGTISYNIMFVSRGGKADENMEDKFFDSIEIQ